MGLRAFILLCIFGAALGQIDLTSLLSGNLGGGLTSILGQLLGGGKCGNTETMDVRGSFNEYNCNQEAITKKGPACRCLEFRDDDGVCKTIDDCSNRKDKCKTSLEKYILSGTVTNYDCKNQPVTVPAPACECSGLVTKSGQCVSNFDDCDKADKCSKENEVYTEKDYNEYDCAWNEKSIKGPGCWCNGNRLPDGSCVTFEQCPKTTTSAPTQPPQPQCGENEVYTNSEYTDYMCDGVPIYVSKPGCRCLGRRDANQKCVKECRDDRCPTNIEVWSQAPYTETDCSNNQITKQTAGCKCYGRRLKSGKCVDVDQCPARSENSRADCQGMEIFKTGFYIEVDCAGKRSNNFKGCWCPARRLWTGQCVTYGSCRTAPKQRDCPNSNERFVVGPYAEYDCQNFMNKNDNSGCRCAGYRQNGLCIDGTACPPPETTPKPTTTTTTTTKKPTTTTTTTATTEKQTAPPETTPPTEVTTEQQTPEPTTQGGNSGGGGGGKKTKEECTGSSESWVTDTEYVEFDCDWNEIKVKGPGCQCWDNRKSDGSCGSCW